MLTFITKTRDSCLVVTCQIIHDTIFLPWHCIQQYFYFIIITWIRYCVGSGAFWLTEYLNLVGYLVFSMSHINDHLSHIPSIGHPHLLSHTEKHNQGTKIAIFLIYLEYGDVEGSKVVQSVHWNRCCCGKAT